MKERKHTIRLTDKEVAALKDRLVPICPADYDLETYAILRDLYGRLEHLELTTLKRSCK